MNENGAASRDLPFITDALPGIGGEIKSEPGHFVVEEIPLYELSGVGDHIYVRFTREGWTTKALAERLTNLFGLRGVDVGWAGLKDKEARVTQTLSLLMPGAAESEVARRIEAELPVDVLSVKRHGNKLKAGHLLGNRFHIVLRDPNQDSLESARAIAERLLAVGVANYYGRQRFGIKGDNATRGRELLTGRGPRDRWLRRLLLSAYQSELFNQWLSERIQRGWFDQIFGGDIAKKDGYWRTVHCGRSGSRAPSFRETGDYLYRADLRGQNALGRRGARQSGTGDT